MKTFIFGLILSLINPSGLPTVLTKGKPIAATTNGLVALYTFDGNTNDSVGSNHGTAVGGPTYTTGKIGEAINFDSNGDQVNTGSDVIGTGATTISTWVYPRTSGQASIGQIINNQKTSLYMNGGGMRFTSDGTINEIEIGAIPFNQWTHIIITRDSGGLATVYLNGALSGAPNRNSGMPSQGLTNLFIGNSSTAGLTFDGLIDEMRIYNRVVTAEEVQGLYNPSIITTPPITPPSDPSTNTVLGNNILENSGFEISAGSRWGYGSGGYGNISHEFNLIDSNVGYNSQSSLKIPIHIDEYSHVLSKIYRLKPNTQYTVSFYMKGAWAYGINASLVNTFSAAQGGGDIISKIVNPSTDSDWRRYSFTGTTNSNPDKSSYQLSFGKTNGQESWNIWIDSIQIEEGGSPTEYSASSPVEVAIEFDSQHKDHTFFADEPVTVTLNQYNNGSTPRQVLIKYETYDYLNRLVNEGSVSSNINATTLKNTSLTFSNPPHRTGSFRVLYWIDGIQNTRDEINYSIVQRPAIMGIDEQSIFGTHLLLKPYFLKSMQKIGVKWNRTLSPGREFRWDSIERVKGNFTWMDEGIGESSRYGITTLASVGSALTSVPAWAKDANGLPNLIDWENFVYAAALRYKDQVKYWEIWNEPDTEGGLGSRPEFYAELLKRAYTQIKRANPNAVIVGMVSHDDRYIDKVFAANAGTPYFDVMSHHIYPGSTLVPFNHTSEYIWKKYNIQNAWNTETGMITKGFLQTPLWEDQWNAYTTAPSGADYRSRADTVIQNFAMSIGSGMKKYFYYDGRNTGSMEFYNSYSLFEWNGTLRPLGTAYATLAYLFEYANGLGEVAVDPNVVAMSFDRKGQAALIIWVKNINQSKLLTTSMARVFDTMGNEITSSNGIKFGSTPIYIISKPGVTREQLLQSISISNTVDTTAPYLSVVTLPTGTSDGKRIDFRWFAIDDITYTQRVGTYVDPAIAYSHKLENYDISWSSWKEGAIGVNGMGTNYKNVPNGTYILKVRARDSSGNESMVTCGPIYVGTPSSTSPICDTPLLYFGVNTTNPIINTNPPIVVSSESINNSSSGQTTPSSSGGGSVNNNQTGSSTTPFYLRSNNSSSTPTKNLNSPSKSTSISSLVFTRTLRLKSIGPDVRQLQIFLNNKGFTIAKRGLGSKGYETTKFGLSTRLALIRFQRFYKLPATGVLDLKTRNKINGMR